MRKYTGPVFTRANITYLIVFITALLLMIHSVEARADGYIIVYKDHTQKLKVLSRPTFAVSHSFNIIPAVAAQLDANQVRQLRANPDVEYIEPDYKIYALGSVNTTTKLSSTINALSSSQTIPYGITMVNAPAVWSITKGAGVRVAVMDTGISMYHPDRGNVVDSVSFVTDETVEDFYGHGTHTSGTIAAADNNIGVVGVVPEVELLIAKVMDVNGMGETSWLISGIEWAVNHHAKVISMSLGSYDYSAALNTACRNAFAAGTLLVAATGDDNIDTPTYPAAFPSVISVAAIDQDKNKASFSNYGPDIRLSAPGVDVYSTVPVATDISATADAVWNSTSHQSNIVTGTAPGTVSGVICDCGLADGSDLQDTCPDSVAGNIAHIRRGTTTFAEKTAHARSKGAIGVIISNNVDGNFYGTLNDGTPLVVVSISKADGDELQTLAQSGITGTVSVDAILYDYYSGTSMACPHVAGVAALIFGAAPYNISPAEVSDILFNSAQDLGQPGRDDIFGYGLVDANAALQLERFNFDNSTRVIRCIVKAGKTQGRDANDIGNIKDYFTVSGIGAFPADRQDINLIEVNIIDVCDNAVIYSQSIDFNDHNDVARKKGKYSYSHRIARGEAGAITSLKIDFTKNPSSFSVIAKNIDLTGLGCPLKVVFAMGDNVLSSREVNEAIVNGRKTLIPTRLMRLSKDTLIVRKAKARSSTRPLGDSLSISGDIAVADMDLDLNEPNLAIEDVNIVWGSSTFTIPDANFRTVGRRHLYKCSRGRSAEDSNNLVTATIDLDKCTYSISVKNVNLAEAGASGNVTFGINFATPHGDFNEAINVNLATGRSY